MNSLSFSDQLETSDILLKVMDLYTYFYTKEGIIKAVDGVDFFIRRGETLGLVGESGCGKSVTARSIMRLIQEPPGKILNGRILLDNQDLLKLSHKQMLRIRGARVAMIFQEPMTSLNPVFRVGDQIAEAIQIHQHTSKRKSMDHSVEMLKKVGIPDPEKCVRNYPHQLSGGMRQRVMIAMALSCNPELMIADEPTTALDVTIQAQILDLMNRTKQDFGASVLLITHDLGVVAEMAQSVAVMYAGKIVEYASVGALFAQPKHPYTMGLMGSIPKMDEPVPENRMLDAIPGTVPSLASLPEGCPFQPRCSQSFSLCTRQSPSLLEWESGHLVRCLLYGNSTHGK